MRKRKIKKLLRKITVVLELLLLHILYIILSENQDLQEESTSFYRSLSSCNVPDSNIFQSCDLFNLRKVKIDFIENSLTYVRM